MTTLETLTHINRAANVAHFLGDMEDWKLPDTTSRMTPEDYRAALDRLGLSQVAAAELLGVDARTSRRWALGEIAIQPSTAKLLALIEDVGIERARRVLGARKA